MFLPTPSETIASSVTNDCGSFATASNAFFSHPYRHTNVSWPENDTCPATLVNGGGAAALIIQGAIRAAPNSNHLRDVRPQRGQARLWRRAADARLPSSALLHHPRDRRVAPYLFVFPTRARFSGLCHA